MKKINKKKKEKEIQDTYVTTVRKIQLKWNLDRAKNFMEKICISSL